MTVMVMSGKPRLLMIDQPVVDQVRHKLYCLIYV